MHANYKQFVIVKQENPAYLARRTQNLFHLGRSQNQPRNDMTASFKNKGGGGFGGELGGLGGREQRGGRWGVMR